MIKCRFDSGLRSPEKWEYSFGVDDTTHHLFCFFDTENTDWEAEFIVSTEQLFKALKKITKMEV